MTISISPIIDSWLDATESVVINPTSLPHEIGRLLRREIPDAIAWLNDPFVKDAFDRYGRAAVEAERATPDADEVTCLVWAEAASVRYAPEIEDHHDLMVECWAIEIENLSADDFDV